MAKAFCLFQMWKVHLVSDTLNKHERIHTCKKPNACFKCNKIFDENCSSKKHGRIHTGEKLFPCSKCNMVFSKRTHLKTHKRTHTGTWKKHERTQTGDSPFDGSKCDKTFKTSGEMKIHESTFSQWHSKYTWKDPHRWRVICLLQMWQDIWRGSTR